MGYRKIAKLKEGEGRIYEVRLNLGDNYVMPRRFMKDWRFSVDERGAYWTRLMKERNRVDVAQKIAKWFVANKCRGRTTPKSVFNSLPETSYECLEIKDDYNEVLYYPQMRPSDLNNLYLTPDKLQEIIDLSKGLLMKNPDNKKRGSFIRTKDYFYKYNREIYIKVADAQYLYKHNRNGKYYACVGIRTQITEGGSKKFIKADRQADGKIIDAYFEYELGELVQSGSRKFFPLKSHNQQKAAAEAKALSEKLKNESK
jgi:hypothetical protein